MIDTQPNSVEAAQQTITALGIDAEYPFSHRFLTVPHGRMHYLDEGKGRPVLMLHGNPTWSFLFRNFVKGLTPTNRVIVPDYIGFGLSEKPEDVADYSIDGHVEDVEKLVISLDLNDITLVVHDWGGPIGLAVASRHPDRIASLVVLNSFAFYPPPGMDPENPRLPLSLRLMRSNGLGSLMVRRMGMFERYAMRIATSNKARYDDVKAAYRGIFQSARDRGGVYAFPRLIPNSAQDASAKLIVREVQPYLEGFTKPVAIFWGDEDPFYEPVMLDGWTQRLPQAEVHHLTKAGHYLQEDAHEEIVPILQEFVARKLE